MVGFDFCSLVKNGQIYGHGRYLLYFWAQSVVQYHLIEEPCPEQNREINLSYTF